MIVSLVEAHDAARFGGKAAGLARALGLGLPVPGGVALDAEAVDAIAGGSPCELPIPAPWAVRSSAIGEDGGAASFAGQHRTELNVLPEGLARAVAAVRASAHTASAAGYRERMGVRGPARMAAVVQAFVPAEAAGVLFTRDPSTGDDARVIEAAPGLGEAVVQGIVTPDRWRMARGGRLLEAVHGEIDRAVRPVDGGGVAEVDEVATSPCLDAGALAALEAMAAVCERAWGGPVDLEFAVRSGRVYLLQCRPVTR